MRSRGAARGERFRRRLQLERLEDRAAPSDLLALLAGGALMGAVDDETAAAEELGVTESALSTEDAPYAEESDGVSLDLSRMVSDEEASAAERERDERVVPAEESPDREPRFEVDASAREGLRVELSAALGDEFFFSPETLAALDAAHALALAAAPAEENSAPAEENSAAAAGGESFAGPADEVVPAAAARSGDQALADSIAAADVDLPGLEGFEGGMMMLMGLPTINVAVNGPDVAEGTSVAQKYKFTRTGGMMGMSLTVSYSMTLNQGTADGTDYNSPLQAGTAEFLPNHDTAYVALTASLDNKVEATETARITVAPGAMYTVGASASATGNILDVPVKVSVSAPDPQAAEEGQETGTFRFSRVGGNHTAELQVRFTVDGSAEAIDYAALPVPSLPVPPDIYQVTIPATQSSVEVTITPYDDAQIEGDEFIRYELQPHPSNTYVIAAPTAMVLIEDNDAEIVVDLDIHHGVEGELVPDGLEFTRGAFTVANLNDTDADGTIDRDDQRVRQVIARQVASGDAGTKRIDVDNAEGFSVGDRIVILGRDENDQQIINRRTIQTINVPFGQIGLTENLSYDFQSAFVFHTGRDEVDLMKLIIGRPSPNLGDAVTLSVLGAAVLFWENPWKETPFTNLIIPVASIPAGGLVLWVEAIEVSTALRDIVLQLEYQGVKDVVRATGIWVQETAMIHNLKSAAELFDDQGDPNDAFDPIWEEMQGDPRLSIETVGGTGLRPIAPAPIGVSNALAIRFTIFPFRAITLDGPWSDDEVYFDATRQRESKVWAENGENATVIERTRWPVEAELPNDDSPNDNHPGSDRDDSDTPLPSGNYFVADAPGLLFDVAEYERFFYRSNFLEVVRVDIGTNPDVGNQIAGTRASPLVPWHSAHTLEKNAATGKYIRTTGDDPEVNAVNSIADGHIEVGAD